MKTYAYRCALAWLAVVVVGCADDGIDHGQIEQVKAALAPYEDVEFAMQEGYFPTEGFAGDANGGIGIHFVNPSVLGVNEDKPNILLYGLEEDGTYKLLAAEWIVPITWVDRAPELFGQRFDGPILAHHDDMVDHYELHVWLFEDNPEGLFALSNPEISPPSFWEELEAAYTSLQKYAFVDEALAAGYKSSGQCVSDGDGGMGVHFVNMDLVYLEPTRPNMLIYQPGEGGKLKLAAAEWMVPADLFGNKAPTLFGRAMDGPFPADHGLPAHFTLHAWLFAANPHGIFQPFNPMISCNTVIQRVQ